MIRAELADGRVLEFPDETHPDVVQATVKKMMTAAPEQPASSPGFLRGVGLGVRDVITGVGQLPALAYNVAAIPQNLLNAGVKAATGYDLGLATKPGAERLEGIADAAGLPRPATAGERLQSDIQRPVAGLIPSMGAGVAMRGAGPIASAVGDALTTAPTSQVAGAAAGGAAAGGAREAGAPGWAQALAGLGGGVAGATAPVVASGLGRALSAAGMPFTAAGREGMVADTLLNSSSEPASLAARLRAGIPDNNRLPGAPVTTATAARDPGLMIAENGLRSDAQALPGAVSPAVALRDVEARRDATRSAWAEGLLNGTPNAAARGENVRRGVEMAEEGLKARTGLRYSQIPDDTEYATAPLNEAVLGIRRMFGPLSGGMPPELAAVEADLKQFGRIATWKDLQDLRSRVGEIAGKASAAGDARTAKGASSILEAIDNLGMSQQWQAASDSRRLQGALLGRDNTGAAATGQILRTDRFGAPLLQDARVASRAIQDAASVRQVLAASDEGIRAARAAGLPAERVAEIEASARLARQSMQDQFIDEMMRKMRTTAVIADASGRTTEKLSPAQFDRFWQQNAETAGLLFERGQLDRLRRLAEDFREGTIAPATASARGSDTAQNLSVGNFISRMSNGLIDPQNPLAQTLVGLGPVARWVLQSPEAATRQLLTQAMADPRVASALLERASPDSIRRAMGYVEQSMPDRIRAMALQAGTREVPRALLETTTPAPSPAQTRGAR